MTFKSSHGIHRQTDIAISMIQTLLLSTYLVTLASTWEIRPKLRLPTSVCMYNMRWTFSTGSIEKSKCLNLEVWIIKNPSRWLLFLFRKYRDLYYITFPKDDTESSTSDEVQCMQIPQIPNELNDFRPEPLPNYLSPH